MSRRHHVAGSQLNRNTHQRQALFKSLLNSLILKEQIQTTSAKAKAIQGLFDKLVSKAKVGTVHVRRLLQAFLGDKASVSKLVDELAPRMQARPSGFTRLTKLGLRKGDNAPVVRMELVDKASVSAVPPSGTPKSASKTPKKATKPAPKSKKK